MNRRHAPGLGAVVGVLIAVAATAQQTLAPAIQASPTDWERTVQILERQVAIQQDRVQTITDKLKATDGQIERRIQRVLEYLVTVTDGGDSGTKVLRAKEDMFDTLKRNIDFYARERGMRFAALYQRTSSLGKADLAEDVRRLNERIDKRVAQALALAASLPAEQEIARYQYVYDDGDLQRRSNPQYAQQHHALGRGDLLRDKAFQGLKASLDNLARSRQELERARPLATTDAARQFVEEQLQRNRELVDKRRQQTAVALLGSNTAGKALGRKAAEALVRLIEDERTNNKQDNAEWIRLKNGRDVERERLQPIATRLAYCQRMLAQASGATAAK